jgi:hypothetical protein
LWGKCRDTKRDQVKNLENPGVTATPGAPTSLRSATRSLTRADLGAGGGGLMVGVLSDTSVGVTNACFRSGDALVLGGGAVGNTQNRGGCATRATSTVHNQEWLCHNVAELGAVVVVLGGECFEFGMCTARSRCATTAT